MRIMRVHGGHIGDFEGTVKILPGDCEGTGRTPLWDCKGTARTR